jgi:hypothetical protein
MMRDASGNFVPLELESSVAFVITGPSQKGERVLIRSRMADIGLVGFTAQTGTEEERQKTDVAAFDVAFRVLGFRRESRNAVWSNDFKILPGKEDSRLACLAFAWDGGATRSERRLLQSDLTAKALDIIAAVQEGDTGRVEWLVAGLISVCEQAKRRAWRRVIMLRAAAFGYTAVLALYANWAFEHGLTR